jgi:hypothetical protein
MTGIFRTPMLTRVRVWLALTVAVVADGIQLSLGPTGWLFADQAIDVVAMCLISALIGFHPLFIPTFIAEFFPVVDMLPTWTGCTAVVIALRRREQRGVAPAPPPPVTSRDDVIDI